MKIAVRELKAQLSRVLALARAGEVVEVRSHDVPIARITGIPAIANGPLAQLISAGAVTWNGLKPKLSPPVALAPGGRTVSAMVVEDRR